MPIHIVYDFEKKEGYMNMPSSDYFLDKGGKRPISKVEIKGDYYIFHNKTIHEVTVNRITLRATLDVVMGVASRFQYVSGSCEKGLKTYDKYQI